MNFQWAFSYIGACQVVLFIFVQDPAFPLHYIEIIGQEVVFCLVSLLIAMPFRDWIQTLTFLVLVWRLKSLTNGVMTIILFLTVRKPNKLFLIQEIWEIILHYWSIMLVLPRVILANTRVYISTVM